MTVRQKQKPPIAIRLPDDLHRHLLDQAKAGYRSLSQEIVMRLVRSLEPVNFPKAPQ